MTRILALVILLLLARCPVVQAASWSITAAQQKQIEAACALAPFKLEACVVVLRDGVSPRVLSGFVAHHP